MMMKRKFIQVLLLNTLLIVSGTIVFSQDDTQTRTIRSDDFTKHRPLGTNRNKQPKKNEPKSKALTYKYVRQDKNIVRRKTNQPKPPSTSQTVAIINPAKVLEVGLTMWKLRPSRSSESGYKLPVLVNQLTEMWSAERIDLDAPLSAGDRVRLAVESSDMGYLYVIDSEIYSDNSSGEPFLLFPASTAEDNSVQPGLLVDIPDQTEDLPYFLIDPKQENYAGELLTVIISPSPLINLKTDQDGKIENLNVLSDLEMNSETEIFSRIDAEDKIYSTTEANSACGAKTRQFVREKSPDKPCGSQRRQLTQSEPLPQTIYRVKTQAGQIAVAFIKLNVHN